MADQMLFHFHPAWCVLSFHCSRFRCIFFSTFIVNHVIFAALVNIVQFGNGVHNKKYSLLLIDAAINKYDELIEFIEASE